MVVKKTTVAPAEPLDGLSSAEATKRLARYGANELAGRKRRSLLAIAAGAVREPLLMLLVAATAIYVVLGDVAESSLLIALMAFDIGIVIYQDRKTERALDSLRELSSPHANVVRDGQLRRIPAREVVPGDLLVFGDGDRVPADAWVVASSALSADESLLTGESVPVSKSAANEPDNPAPPRPGGDDLPFVFSGTLIIRGQGTARAIRTGQSTEIGRIGRSLSELSMEDSALRDAMRQLARNLSIVAVLVSLAVISLQLYRSGMWLGALLSGITTAMAMLPEELPVVFTVFLTLGAWRMSRRNLLTRRLTAIEALGGATVLCTDKTGTLTENRMMVTAVATANGSHIVTLDNDTLLEPEANELLEHAALASDVFATDPMESAFQRAAEAHGLPRAPVPERIYGLRPGFFAVVHARRAKGQTFLIAAKGAPEALADLCKLDVGARDKLLARATEMAAEGLRVLAVARGRQEGMLPEEPRDFDLRLLGLLGLSDPVRAEIPAAVAKCRQAGIRVVMVTGDYPATARAIARQAGIANGGLITGQELIELEDAELLPRLAYTTIFARVLPEQKLRIVNALKAIGEIVAMTGDGVNDAPALKAAHVGIAMGQRGTDVAREAAALVLLDDAFGSIVAAVRLGRRIFDNLRKATAYILSVHVPVAGAAIFPLLFGWPALLLPVHIVFLELIIDPACSIAFEAEPEEPGTMRRPPRDPHLAMFDRREIALSVALGAVALAATLVAYRLAAAYGLSESAARTVGFIAIVAVNVGLILSNRSWSGSLLQSLARPNPVLWTIVGGAAVFLFAIIAFPLSAALFDFSPPPAPMVALGAAAGIAVVAVAEAAKRFRGT